MIEPEIAALIKNLRLAKDANQFSTFIDFIQFPKYRCMLPGTRIDFRFPFTVLVGQNGSGKTSVLQALYGAPDGMSISKHWFGTAVDPIDLESDRADQNPEEGQKAKQKFQGERSAFWYGYHQGGQQEMGEQLEAVKTRIWRKDDPDYWEPSRPIQNYGMRLLPGKTRSPQIQMQVKYLSLRFNLNAFDRCFHFSAESTMRVFRSRVWAKKKRSGKPNIQDYLRHRSRHLKKAISENIVVHSGKAAMNEMPTPLTNVELKAIGAIIGKEYASGMVIDHRCYETQGRSVVLVTANHTYSEAFAGSGESLVVNLVVDVLRAPPKSLLLLDEPETSLHPGAQRKLLEFLLRQTLERKLQVVVSTHSAEIVRGLPNDAIKVFRPGQNGTVEVEQQVSWEEAFFVIGQHFDPSTHVIVEDKLAELLVTDALKSHGQSFAHKFRVEHRPGGDSRMNMDIALAITTKHSQPIFLFDGDQMPSGGICDTEQLRQAELNPSNLDKIIFAQTGQKISFHENSNSTSEEKSKIRQKFLKYYKEKARFLPFDCPEAAIWNSKVCELFLTTIQVDPSVVKSQTKEIETKEIKGRYAFIADKYGIGIDSVHKMFVLAFQNGQAQAWTQLKSFVKTLAENGDA